MDDHEHCAQCGFDGSAYSNEELLATLRGLGPRWRALLDSAGDDLRRRPAPEVWSAIEYAEHSRDITALHVFGVEQALTVDEPSYPDFAADAVDNAAKAYGEGDPIDVVDELQRQAVQLADLVAAADDAQWQRGLTVGADRSTVRRLLEHALHDSTHHLDDVERGLMAWRVR